jgi:hypothetical protein
MPSPVASVRPAMPPCDSGLPVTTPAQLMSPSPKSISYVSFIHAISRGPVPMSGAGTSLDGPMKPLRASSIV